MEVGSFDSDGSDDDDEGSSDESPGSFNVSTCVRLAGRKLNARRAMRKLIGSVHSSEGFALAAQDPDHLLFTLVFFDEAVAADIQLARDISGPPEVQQQRLLQILGAWRMELMETPADGNCLFHSVWHYINQYLQSGHVATREHLNTLGFTANMEPIEAIGRLRELMVNEWRRNLAEYQGFLSRVTLAYVADDFRCPRRAHFASADSADEFQSTQQSGVISP
eukprot:comp24351_c2_seq3/m.46580 comp24351_c2_seq3/g.46580  ORF comp24351_c2_seq3/g.46580 comp24351_c2_seq3/m.46580 type:complete len:222 (-) comp24351_c2_seq3:750-1415(-)